MTKSRLYLGILALFLLAGCTKTYSEEENVYYPIGDSITWLDGNKYANSNEKAVGYPSIIESELGFDGVINKGVNGASLAKNANYPESGSILLDNDWTDANLADEITILAGTNDFKLDVPIGEIKESDFDEATYLGAYQSLIETLKDANSEAKIVLITPLQRDNADYDINTINKSGYKLVDYVNGVIQLGEKYDLQVIDLYNNSEITLENIDDYTVDGLHPNKEGFEIIASEIIDAVN